jgi:hypothetical protein
VISVQVTFSLRKVGSISQEFNVGYTKNSGKFVVFIEDINWKPQAFIDENAGFLFDSNANLKRFDPCTSFYNAILRSMGLLFKFTTDILFFEYGDTSLKLPFIDRMRMVSRGEEWGIVEKAYRPKVVVQVDKVLQNGVFYKNSITGREAG